MTCSISLLAAPSSRNKLLVNTVSGVVLKCASVEIISEAHINPSSIDSHS